MTGDISANAATYLPASLLRAVAVEPSRSLPWAQEIEGTAVMADLSGFTPLSETLGRLGDEGAERLTDIINSFFARVLKAAFRYGGDIINFGGDAILLLLEGQQHASRAVAASLTMLEQTARMGAVDSGNGRIKLGMSVGAASGTFLLTAAGLAEERVHIFLMGREAEVTAQAESCAEKGQLVVSSPTLDLLVGERAAAQVGDFWRVDEFMPGTLPRSTLASPRWAEGLSPHLGPYLPSYLAQAPTEEGMPTHLIPEHRRVWAVFVSILGFNELLESAGLEAALDELQDYCALLTRLATKHHGFVVNSDITTKGSKLLVTFGAPVAHEYAAEKAARFAVELNEHVLSGKGSSLKHRIGINGGHVFAGEVGPDFRRQYTVMGDEVNLAARLMATAEPGQILVRRSFAEDIGPGSRVRGLGPIRVKGKRQPVEVCLLEALTAKPGRGEPVRGMRRAPVFGRKKELARIAGAWRKARSEAGQALLIVGEAGVGKTTLLEHALVPIGSCAGVARTTCYEHLQVVPYAPWIEVLDQVFCTSRRVTIDQRTATVGAWLQEHAPALTELASLLNPILAVSFEMGDVVRSLDGPSRRERLHFLIGDVLAAAGRRRALLVVLEDMHWADESSLELMRGLLPSLAKGPLLLLATARPFEGLSEFGACTDILELRELSAADTTAMVREALKKPDLPNELIKSVYHKTKGNPLFTEEVIRELARPGALDRILSVSSVSLSDEMAKLAIPDRVQGLLMSQIDRLSAESREILKAASVIGRVFGVTELQGMNDEVVNTVTLDQALGELAAASLVLLSTASDESSTSYQFRHALIQEVAYDSLPFARRRSLHLRIGGFLEENSENPDDGILVHHYRYAEDHSELREHAAKAAESSMAAYGYHEAIDYLDLAFGATRARRAAHANLRSRLDEMAGDSYCSLGRHEEAIARYLRARRSWMSPRVKIADTGSLAQLQSVERPDEREAELCRKIALAALRSFSDQKRAIRWAQKAEACVPEDRPMVASEIAVARSVAYSRLGRYEEALATAEEALLKARRSGNEPTIAHALNGLVNACGWLGLFDRVLEACAEVIELSRKTGELNTEAIAHGNMALCYELTGNCQESLLEYDLSLALYRRLGNSAEAARTENNMSTLYLTMGQPNEAAAHAGEAVRDQSCKDSPNLVGCALLNLARAKTQLGELKEAESALAEARVLLHRADSQGFLLYADLGEAELERERGDAERARATASKALDKARSMGVPFQEVDVLLFLGSLELDSRNLPAARMAIEAGISRAHEVGAEHERAVGLLLLAQLQTLTADELEEGVSPLATLGEARDLFDKMGATQDLARARELHRRIIRTTSSASGETSSEAVLDSGVRLDAKS